MRIATLAVCGLALFQGQATFKSTTAMVEVDAIFLDRDGNFIPGIKPGDVTIYENGKPQKIQQFFMVTRDLGLTQGAVASEYAQQAQYSAHRVFVLVFDEGHLGKDSLMRVKAGAERFVQEMVAPGDAAGVFVNGGMYKGRLTEDKGELLAAIRSVQPAFDSRDEILAPFREWPRINSEMEAARIADGAREVTDALAEKACEAEPVECQGIGGPGEVENKIQQKARLYVRQARILTDQTIRNLESVSRGLARVAGRKTVVLMSEGFFVEDSRSVLQTVAAQAARAGLTIYSIDGRGRINTLSSNPDVTRQARARSPSFDTGEDGPNILAEGTGGFTVRGIDDISLAFGRIIRDTSTYYVIGYQPENTRMDGKVRKIQVKTTVAGARVRARTSYAATVLPPQDAIWGPGRD